ncbi:MAG: DUF6588 family protein [Bacteroidota bacterium]
MKNRIFTTVVLFTAFVYTNRLNAQGEGAAILKAGTQDANKILNAYMSPLFKGFASGSTAGWYNTARTHGMGGFDITLSLPLFTVPEEENSYTFNSLGLGSGSYSFSPKTAGTDPGTKLGTLFGPAVGDQQYNINYGFSFDTVIGGNPVRLDTSILIGSITMPPGGNVPIAPSIPPAMQLSVGVYKNTDVMLRILPEVTLYEGFKASMLGFGVKHDIKQWIPAIKELPLWDWSVIFGYNSFNATYTIPEPNRLKVDGNPEYQLAYNAGDFAGKTYANQRFEFNGSGWMLGTIISARLLFFTPYLGINYNRATTSFAMLGDYPLLIAETDKNNPNFGKSKVTELNDPIKIEGSVSGLRINPGFRIKMLVMTLHYDFSWNTYGYHLHTVGLGVNVQSLLPPSL